MQQFILGAILLIAGILLDLIYNRMRQTDAKPEQILDVREVSAHLREGKSGTFTVRAPLQTEQPSVSALDGKAAAYWEARVLALEGNRQREVYSGKSEGQPFLQDAPGEEKLWVDIPSFGDSAELLPSHMDTAQPGSELFRTVEKLVSYHPGKAFCGYRVLEGCIRPGQQVLLSGTVRRHDGKLLAQAGVHGQSRLTYREPEAASGQAQLSTSGKVLLAVGAAAVVAGLLLVISGLL